MMIDKGSGYIYLAGPYSHPDAEVRHARYQALTAKAAELMLENYVVFSPITHGHAVAMGHNLPTDFAWWELQCLGMLRHASKLVVLTLDGWEHSKGVEVEVEFARKSGISIEYIPAIDI